MIYGINLFYFSSNHPSCCFNQDVSPTSNSNDSNHSINTHFFLLPYLKRILKGCQEDFKNSNYAKRSGGSSVVMSLSNYAHCIKKGLHNQKSLAECIETPNILKDSAYRRLDTSARRCGNSTTGLENVQLLGKIRWSSALQYYVGFT